jgi:indolepyruvate ferredoxin oxidoreductase, beta subunit
MNAFGMACKAARCDCCNRLERLRFEPNMTQAISILLCALGGEGGGVLADWLVDVARHADHPAQATSIPGVAQRTGATTYYIEVFPQPHSALGGKRPVLGLNPLPGRLDALVSSELLETARQISNGLTSAEHSCVITSSSRILTTTEKMSMGDGRQNDDALLKLVRMHSKAHHIVDMARMTQKAGTVVSAVMLGCIAASGLLPFSRAEYESVIGHSGKAAKASLRGFGMGYDAVAAQRQHQDFIESVMAPSQPPPPEVPGAVAQAFPAPLHPMVSLGYARVLEYQNLSYAQTYLERLDAVWSAEKTARPDSQAWPVTEESARWLALWMAFDDVVRVADLKSRESRLHRVRGEVKAQEADLLKIYDHFKPGVPELAGLLPTRWAQSLIRWDRARVAKGLGPWALPLKIRTHSVTGMLALRLMASLKVLRPLGSRFRAEQQAIEQWTQAVILATHRDRQLGHEVARCGQLIKGYGSTNERGKDNLMHIITHAATHREGQSTEEQVLSIARIRQAALQDEAGKSLDAALIQSGAPARPVVAQPIRWMKNPRTTS